MFIAIKETTKLSKTPSMPRKHLFLPGYHFFKLLSGLLDFHGDFHKQSKVSNGFMKFYDLLEDIFLICSFLFFCFQITFSFILVALQFSPKASDEWTICLVNIYWIASSQHSVWQIALNKKIKKKHWMQLEYVSILRSSCSPLETENIWNASSISRSGLENTKISRKWYRKLSCKFRVGRTLPDGGIRDTLTKRPLSLN